MENWWLIVNVGLLSMKVLERIIEDCAAKEGFKVGRGVLMVPLEKLKTDYLEEGNINYFIRHIWV